MESAPFLDDSDGAPTPGRAVWTQASDGLRLRIGHWRATKAAPKGTVLLFNGRTEYVEKYGETAEALAARGYGSITIDWRGQGLSDRMLEASHVGHVVDFTDYQKDVQALVEAAERLDLPRPWYLLAHSMGGTIGLRALMEGLPVKAAVFSAPMWGIEIPPLLRPVAIVLSWGGVVLGLGHLLSPGTSAQSYVLSEDFEANKLTRDPEAYARMQRQTALTDSFALGGPSLRWLHEALKETRHLAHRPAPTLPCLTFLGSAEQIVDAGRIRQRMAAWPGGRLVEIDSAEHEVLMERPHIREGIIEQIDGFFGKGGA